MFATWILFIFIMLIAPFLTIQAGFLRATRCGSMDAERGYRSKLALSSQEAWAYAQKSCSMRYMATGVVMAMATLLAASVLPAQTPLQLLVYTGVIVLVQVAVVLFLIATVEGGLRARFGVKKED